MAFSLNLPSAMLLQSLSRSILSLLRPQIWHRLLLPVLLSLLFWGGLAFWGLGRAVDLFLGSPPLSLLSAWGMLWLAHVLAWIGGWMLIFTLAYLSTTLLTACLLMPWLVRAIACRDYADVAPAGKDSLLAGAANGLLATLLFAGAWLCSLPFWLIPGMSLLLPLLLMAWFNRRTFAFDALCAHASLNEWREIGKRHRQGFFGLGLLMAVLAHVPVFGLLAPAFAALAYVHYGLEALRRLRGAAVISGEARVIAVE